MRLVLLTATPMKNLASEVVSLSNLLRPYKDPIQRKQLFVMKKRYDEKLKSGADQLIRQYLRGYISYVKCSDPIFFA